MNERLPLWRAVSGFGVLGSLAAIVLAVVPEYVANYRFSQYAQAMTAHAELPDEKLQAEIAGAAVRDYHLILPPGDVHVLREGAKIRLQIAKHKARVFVVDLHFGEISTR